MRFFIIIICVLLLNLVQQLNMFLKVNLLLRNNIHLVENKKINKYEVKKIIKQNLTNAYLQVY